MKMNKVEAIRIVLAEHRRLTYSQSSVNRTVKALKFLGYDGDDLIAVLRELDICKEDGSPCYSKLTRTW